MAVSKKTRHPTPPQGIQITPDDNPTRVMARFSRYSGASHEYGEVKHMIWYHTNVFLTIDEWREVSYERTTEQIMNYLCVKPLPKGTLIQKIAGRFRK